MRPSQRKPNELRPITLTRRYTKHAEGATLAEFGDTRVLCTASVTEGVPRFLRDSGRGWLTAEYSLLPRSTHTRTEREAARGGQNGRTQEIQRLIGRALRAAVDLTALGHHTLTIDCDVLQADGGTRTAAITGGCVALVDALRFMQEKGLIKTWPLRHYVAAVSVGLYAGEPVLDLDYAEDAQAHTDMNVVMTDTGGFIEIQGTGENGVFHEAELSQLVELAKHGIQQLCEKQRAVLSLA